MSQRDTIGRRIVLLAKRLGFSQVELAAHLGVPVDSLAKQWRDERAPGSEALEKFAAKGVNLNWLVTGEGEMFSTDGQALRAEAVLAPYSLKARDAGLSWIYHLNSDLVQRVSERLEALALFDSQAALADRTYVAARAAMRLIEDAGGDSATLARLLSDSTVVDAYLRVEHGLMLATRNPGGSR